MNFLGCCLCQISTMLPVNQLHMFLGLFVKSALNCHILVIQITIKNLQMELLFKPCTDHYLPSNPFGPKSIKHVVCLCLFQLVVWSILTATGPHFHKYLSRGSSSEDQTSFSTCTRGLLKFMTDRGRIYLSTSRCNFRGTDMLNNGHMMIMFLAVTSRFAMAMVPFARTATSVTMMSPTMIVTSSMVTTTTATMSAITVTMLMNMMSPAMTVVLVNKMSPAVTVMPSDVTSCTSVMSTGTVVS
ncbi:uncharacterized protein LOC114322435 isoform X2 [Camellia sinensis]|uniref:uncharacterized protein LOC114322435 isoform X2 n=1 Tax=Camellia sinensis TaxID=4442 RepID=UPI001036C8E1|nr:uncharacterized protein LOC114322435 isoform X2 [Camellia sinensis]